MALFVRDDAEPGTVATFWDENRRKVTLDPAFWMAHPACREAINRRIGEDPSEWTLDRFRRLHSPAPFQRGISWGSGLGAFERAVVRLGIAREVDAFDLSPASVADARSIARKEGIEGVRFQLGDFNDPAIERGRYDAVFFHQSLHHVSALERLFRRLAIALRPGAALYIDEYVGPARGSWRPGMLDAAQSVLDRVPPEARLRRTLAFPVCEEDPSEAIRSDEIAKFVREFFDIREWKPYGGQIVDLVFPAISREWAHSPAGCRATLEMLKLEDEELARNPDSSHYLYAFGTLKSKARLFPPIARQVGRAVARRMKER
jgi:SAM-dependent methyltransferase